MARRMFGLCATVFVAFAILTISAAPSSALQISNPADAQP